MNAILPLRPSVLVILFCCCLTASCSERPAESANVTTIEVADAFSGRSKSVSYEDAANHLQRMQHTRNADFKANAHKLRWNGTVKYILAIQNHPDSNFPNFIEKNLQRISANTPVSFQKFETLEEIAEQRSGISILFITNNDQITPYRDVIEIGRVESSASIDELGCRMEQRIAGGLSEQPDQNRNIIIQIDPDFPHPESLTAPHYALRRVKNDDMRNMFWQRRCSVWALLYSMGFAISSPDSPTKHSSAYSMNGAESTLTKYDLAALQLYYSPSRRESG